jgi:poly(3-hydroxybutyrate) depolymerase
MIGSGGQPGTGGTSETGGHIGSGGASSGGQPGTGGVSETGGRIGSGGASAVGGTAAGGGRSGTGGATLPGGTMTGGQLGAGGSTVASGVDGGTSSGAAVPSAGCGKTHTLQNSPGTTKNYNKVASGRQYILRLPDNYDNNHPYRLILSYHWATGSASQVFDCTTEGINCYTTQSPFFGLLALANNTTIFIAPDGTGGLWSNTGDADVTFTDDILKQVEDDLCIDTSRIELEGFSMGGAMAMTLICERPGVFRAAATHSAGGQPKPTSCQPIPYFASLGSQESGGQTSTADFFAQSNGCTIDTLPKAPTGGHVCSDYKGCSAGHPVRWCPFDGGHTPSPKDSGQNTTWMPKEVWTFLSQY